MGKRRAVKTLAERAYDLQTAISAARIDREAQLHRGRTSGNFTDDQVRAIEAYRASPDGRALSALWELAGVVSRLAQEVEQLRDAGLT